MNDFKKMADSFLPHQFVLNPDIREVPNETILGDVEIPLQPEKVNLNVTTELEEPPFRLRFADLGGHDIYTGNPSGETISSTISLLPSQHFARAWYLGNTGVISNGPFVFELLSDVSGNARMRIAISHEYEASVQLREVQNGTSIKYKSVDSGGVVVQANPLAPWIIEEIGELYVILLSPSSTTPRRLSICQGLMSVLYIGDDAGIIRGGNPLPTMAVPGLHGGLTSFQKARKLKIAGVSARRTFIREWRVTDSGRDPTNPVGVFEENAPSNEAFTSLAAINDYLHLTDASVGNLTFHQFSESSDIDTALDNLQTLTTPQIVKILTAKPSVVFNGIGTATSATFGGASDFPSETVQLTDLSTGIVSQASLNVFLFAKRDISDDIPVFGIHISVTGITTDSVTLKLEGFNISHTDNTLLNPVSPLVVSEGSGIQPTEKFVSEPNPDNVNSANYIISYPLETITYGSHSGEKNKIHEKQEGRVFSGAIRMSYDFLSSTEIKTVVNFKVNSNDFVIAAPGGPTERNFLAFWDPVFSHDHVPDIVTIARPTGYTIEQFVDDIGGDLVYRRLGVPTHQNMSNLGYVKTVSDLDAYAAAKLLETDFNDETAPDAIVVWRGTDIDPVVSTIFAVNRVYSLNHVVRPITPTGANPRLLYKVSTAGTSGVSEPVWPTTAGQDVVSGTVTFTSFLPSESVINRLEGDFISWGRAAYRYCRLIEIAARGVRETVPVTGSVSQSEEINDLVKEAASKVWTGVKKILSVDNPMIPVWPIASEITSSGVSGTVETLDLSTDESTSVPENTMLNEYRSWQRIEKLNSSIYGGVTTQVGSNLDKFAMITRPGVSDGQPADTNDTSGYISDTISVRKLREIPEVLGGGNHPGTDSRFYADKAEAFSFYENHHVSIGYIFYAIFVALRYSLDSSTARIEIQNSFLNSRDDLGLPILQALLQDVIAFSSQFESDAAREQIADSTTVFNISQVAFSGLNRGNGVSFFPPCRDFDVYHGISFNSGVRPGSTFRQDSIAEAPAESAVAYYGMYRFLTEVRERFPNGSVRDLVGKFYTSPRLPAVAHVAMMHEMANVSTVFRPSESVFSAVSEKVNTLIGTGATIYGSRGFPVSRSETLLRELFSGVINGMTRTGVYRGTGRHDLSSVRFSETADSRLVTSIGSVFMPLSEPLSRVFSFDHWPEEIRDATLPFGNIFSDVTGWINRVISVNSLDNSDPYSVGTSPSDIRAWARHLSSIIEFCQPFSGSELVFPSTNASNYLPQSSFMDLLIWFKYMTGVTLVPDSDTPCV